MHLNESPQTYVIPFVDSNASFEKRKKYILKQLATGNRRKGIEKESSRQFSTERELI